MTAGDEHKRGHMQIDKLGDEALARKLAKLFEDHDYPYLGVELELDGRYPIISMWDDGTQSNHLIAVASRRDDLDDARKFIESVVSVLHEDTEQYPCGVWGEAVCGEMFAVFEKALTPLSEWECFERDYPQFAAELLRLRKVASR